MKHYVQKLIALIALFIMTFAPSLAAEVKINGLVFDNADNLIYIKTNGTVDDTVTFSKGILKDPDRIYLDINNAILTTQKKSYTGKFSVFKNIKISQFTIDPKTVRLVFEHNPYDTSKFEIFKAKNGIFIKTGKNLVEEKAFKTVYSNTNLNERSAFYKGAKIEENSIIQASDLINNDNIPKNEIMKELTVQSPVSKIASKYYLDSISKTKQGILLNGIGKISVMPSFTLKDPDRLVIDLDDTVVAPELRNKTYPIGELETATDPAGGELTIDKRETVKIGQNSQNVARLVIQGEGAKNYRGIISPDSKSFYITNKTNIIGAKMSDNNAVLTKTAYSTSKDTEIISLAFDDSVAFNTFEENSNLYVDINNLNSYTETALEPILKGIPNLQTIRIATDKLRLVIPEKSTESDKKHINIKTSPDNDEIKIYTKIAQIQAKPKPKDVVTVPVKKERTSEISNLFTVVIDAGHGGNDVGATRNDIFEKDITLKVSKMVEKNLNKKNVKTYMVRSKDKTVSLAERCEYSNEKKPNLFVSIHVNSSLNDAIYGIETHWYKEDSFKYANYVHDEMKKKVNGWKTTDRGLFKSQFYVINHTDAPAILCEIGFISNSNEREEIIKTKRQEEIAEAIANGIYNYLKAAK